MTRPLCIVADGRVALDEVRRGIGKTVIALYRALSAVRPTWQFHLYCRTTPSPELFAGCDNIHTWPIEMPGDRLDLWGRIRLPLGLASVRPDLVHALAGRACWPLTAPLVTTIYDLIPIDPVPRNPEAVRWGNQVRATARRSRLIITSSAHARSRIEQVLGIPGERIHCVPWAPVTLPAIPPSPERRRELAELYRFEAGGRYVLHFGMGDPRKNTRHLLAEWKRLPTSVTAGVRLVVVGVEPAALGELQLHVSPGVSVSGYVAEADARDLLGGAALVAYLTLYEGFGLPLIEAFAAGVPVVAADRTSLPEVAGGAAELIDPVMPGALARGIERVLSDVGYADELRRRGHRRAMDFSWPATAEGFAQVFEQAVYRPARQAR